MTAVRIDLDTSAAEARLDALEERLEGIDRRSSAHVSPANTEAQASGATGASQASSSAATGGDDFRRLISMQGEVLEELRRIRTELGGGGSKAAKEGGASGAAAPSGRSLWTDLEMREGRSTNEEASRSGRGASFARGGANFIASAAAGSGGGMGMAVAGLLGGIPGIIASGLVALGGAIMSGGKEQVQHNKSMMQLVRTEAMTALGTGRDTTGYTLQRDLAGAAALGVDKNEIIQARAALLQGAGNARASTIGSGQLADLLLAGQDASSVGQFLGARGRGSAEGANTATLESYLGATMSNSGFALRGHEPLQLLNQTIEKLANRGISINVDSIEQFVTRAASVDAIKGGGLAALRGMMSFVGSAEQGRSKATSGFRDLISITDEIAAYQAAGASGKGGFDYLLEIARAHEDPELMGPDARISRAKAQFGSAGAALSLADYVSTDVAQGMVDGMPTDAAPMSRPSMYSTDFQKYAPMVAQDSLRDFAQLGNAEAMQSIINMERMMTQATRSLDSMAGGISDLVLRLGGR